MKLFVAHDSDISLSSASQPYNGAPLRAFRTIKGLLSTISLSDKHRIYEITVFSDDTAELELKFSKQTCIYKSVPISRFRVARKVPELEIANACVIRDGFVFDMNIDWYVNNIHVPEEVTNEIFLVLYRDADINNHTFFIRDYRVFLDKDEAEKAKKLDKNGRVYKIVISRYVLRDISEENLTNVLFTANFTKTHRTFKPDIIASNQLIYECTTDKEIKEKENDLLTRILNDPETRISSKFKDEVLQYLNINLFKG
ncbi:hypothetical protein KNT64_gp037 [Pseudomonas phage PspYZU05]|uniref:Uncharacterized protein n=1 Tax=Pseudomonas phage PspYZU05 TaxID=1983556 RepID=A0A2U7NBP1_9CAUD|nr:hypothetical protein KNT64_gp037 [Pseudomonas phage PspYZU05]ASD51989.1 hypothetical protein PspYZU05_37 [Pseudomonas phage PspYZU05]